MSQTKILTMLRTLHDELAALNADRESAQEVDEPTLEALGQIVTDASSLLDQIRDQPDEDTLRAGQLDLSDRILKFESDHPRVAALLNQVTDLLAMMGI